MKLIALILGATVALAASLATADDSQLVPLNLKLPSPVFLGTPSDQAIPANVEKPTGKPRPPLMVPPGLANLALAKPVTCSSSNVMVADLKKLTDGDKDSRESSVILVPRGPQWLQLDLGAEAEIFAIVIWHNDDAPKIYHGVVVEVSDNPAFKDAKILFNNDQANLDGLGVGSDREYFETNEGKLVDAHGVKARYVRFYANGSTESRLNEYLEAEVWGRPAK